MAVGVAVGVAAGVVVGVTVGVTVGVDTGVVLGGIVVCGSVGTAPSSGVSCGVMESPIRDAGGNLEDGIVVSELERSFDSPFSSTKK